MPSTSIKSPWTKPTSWESTYNRLFRRLVMNDEDQPIPVSQVVNGRAAGRYPPGFRPPPLEKYTPAVSPPPVRVRPSRSERARTAFKVVVFSYGMMMAILMAAFVAAILYRTIQMVIRG